MILFQDMFARTIRILRYIGVAKTDLVCNNLDNEIMWKYMMGNMTRNYYIGIEEKIIPPKWNKTLNKQMKR